MGDASGSVWQWSFPVFIFPVWYSLQWLQLSEKNCFDCARVNSDKPVE